MFSRRHALKTLGLGSSSLGLAPFLLSMKAHAAGDDAMLPKRFVFLIKENGLAPDGITPEGQPVVERHGTDAYHEKPLQEMPLPGCMKALEGFKDHVNIIQGLSSRIGSGNHGFSFGTLGVYPGQKNRALAETIDGALAKHFPAAFPHLGFETNPGKMVNYPFISALGKDQVLPFYVSPTLAYNQLFGAASGNEKVQIENQMDQDLLGFMSDDIKRVQKKLNSAEKDKLEHYLRAFEALSDRRVKVAQMEGLAKHTPELSDKYTSDIETHTQEAHFDMATSSLIAGLTNVVTMKLDHLGLAYRGLGHDMTTHGIGHAYETLDSRTTPQTLKAKRFRDEIRAHHFNLIGSMAGKLRDVPEGNGTMLDNTLIVYLSYSGARHHPRGQVNFPFVTVGNLAGKLRTGRYMHFPRPEAAEHRTYAGLYNSILHAAGKPQKHFGEYDPKLERSKQDGPIPELMVS